jgi:hypothetical protein
MYYLYKPIKRNIRFAFDSYTRNACQWYKLRRSEFNVRMNLNTKMWYTSEQLKTIYEDAEFEWIKYSEIECFESRCAWCYERRCTTPADHNEHDECDKRLYYLSYEGIVEQETTLCALKPKLPTEVTDRIMQFLGLT